MTIAFFFLYSVQEEETDKITFYLKGADVVMVEIIHYCDWLEEVVDMMANEGLRTLVVASKTLSKKQYQDFEVQHANHTNMVLMEHLITFARFEIRLQMWNFFALPPTTLLRSV